MELLGHVSVLHCLQGVYLCVSWS